MNERFRKAVQRWLYANCLLVLVMIGVGGVTRLTDSGLSMVQWQPILGAVPPITEEQWQARFDQYRQFPEYQLRNSGMSLAEFKGIFFWEYLHRVLGRLIGLAYGIPLVVFALLRAFDRRWLILLLGGLFLGGLQGVIGWVMVKSGLVDVPYVSHYRLALHLCTAFLIFAYLFFLALRASPRTSGEEEGSVCSRGLLILFSLYALQVVYGAFVAGLNAGYMFNTFPTMMGYWVPPGLDSLVPLWKNLLDNPVAVQWIHRSLAWLFAAGVIGLWGHTVIKVQNRRARQGMHALLLLTFVQFWLGVFTLILHMPIPVAVLHQVNACLVLGAFTFLFEQKTRSRIRA